MARRRRFFLRINEHVDTCIIANAIREHCQKQVDAWHAAFVKARYEDKNETEAQRCLGHREETRLCMDRTLKRLDQIQRRMEAVADATEAEGGGDQLNGCPGDVGARDAF